MRNKKSYKRKKPCKTGKKSYKIKKPCKKRSRRKTNKKGGGKQITIFTDTFHRVFLIAHLDDTYCDEPADAKYGLAFEYSSGTSNPGQNYPNTFLPIRYVEKSCHMKKSEYLYSDKLDGNIDLSLFSGSCPSAELHLEYFMNRFRCWKELQISAALGGGRDARSAWQVFSYFRKLRVFVLSHDYDTSTKQFIPRDSENVIMPFDWETTRYVPFATEMDQDCDPTQINLWLERNGVKIVQAVQSEKKELTELSRNTFITYRAKIRNADYKLSDILEPDFEVELPKDILKIRPENIDAEVLKDLNKMVSDLNSKKYKEKISRDLDEIKGNPLYKYIDLIKYSINQGKYTANLGLISEDNIITVLKKMEKKFPMYTTDNPFNWKIC